MSRQKNVFIQRLTNEGSFRRSTGPLWQPAVDIYRCPEGWKIKFDLAGVKPEDIQVLVADDRLIVRGVRRDGVITEGWSYYQLEITYSRFEKTLQFPSVIEGARIEHNFEDGILIIRLWKAD